MSVYITVVRGQLKKAESLEENKAAHDAINVPLQTLGKSLSAIGHRAYLNAENPKEFLGIDTWTTLEGPQRLFSDPKLAAEFEQLFEEMPQVSYWRASGWESFSDV
jgi:hypothetical protein